MKTPTFIFAIAVFLAALLTVSFLTVGLLAVFFAFAFSAIMCALAIYLAIYAAHEPLEPGWLEYGAYGLLFVISAMLTYAFFFTTLFTDFAGQTPIDLAGFKAASLAWFISGVLGIIYLLATKPKNPQQTAAPR